MLHSLASRLGSLHVGHVNMKLGLAFRSSAKLLSSSSAPSVSDIDIEAGAPFIIGSNATMRIPEIDEHGRAYATGRRKTSVARVR
jgi:hypothetical protein